MKENRASTVWIWAAVLVLLPAMYVGSYYGTMNRVTVIESSPGPIAYYQPDYRFGGNLARNVFEPMHRIDRVLRPAFWDASDFF